MTRMSLLTTVAAAALFSLSTMSMGAADGTVGGARAAKAGPPTVSNCTGATTLLSIQSSAGQSTSSTSFVDVVGSARLISTTLTRCVIISFSGQVFAPNSGSSGGLMFLQAVLDGTILSQEGPIQFQSDSIT